MFSASSGAEITVPEAPDLAVRDAEVIEPAALEPGLDEPFDRALSERMLVLDADLTDPAFAELFPLDIRDPFELCEKRDRRDDVHDAPSYAASSSSSSSSSSSPAKVFANV